MNTQLKTLKSSLQAYFDQVRQYPLLTYEEEIELSKKVMDGDKSAAKKLVESNLRLVVKMAKPYVSKGMSFHDLIQEGNIGLIKAAKKYDYRKNVRFSTYAVWWIRQAILRAIVNKSRPIRIPQKKEEALRKSKEARSMLFQKLMREPSLDEVAKEIKITSKKLSKLEVHDNEVVSLDAKINNSEESYISLFRDDSYNPSLNFFHECRQNDTLKSLNILDERERQVILYRYSFYNGEKYTLRKISSIMGIAPETVRQIEKRAIERLKKEAFRLKEYVYA